MSYRARHDPTAFLKAADGVIEARIARAEGSSPRGAGTAMLISEAGAFGTIGGGALELKAVARARGMLASGEASAELTLPLGPEIGQCCGGRVAVTLTALDAPARAARIAAAQAAWAALRPVYLFGAGHVGGALARAFALAPVRATLIDQRVEALAEPIEGVETRLSALPEAEIRAAGPGAAFLILTHDHALDFLLAGEALARGDAAYVGMIGSKSKRAQCLSRLGDAVEAETLVCPMGAAGVALDPAMAKRPEVIASFVVAEVLSRLYPAA